MLKILIFVAVAVFFATLETSLADNIDKDAVTISYKNDPADPDGNYAYYFDTSNGIQQQEAGNINGVVGTYEYIAQDGEKIFVSYTADENGFRPSGDHLPTPPPIPDAIIRALEYIAAHPPPATKANNVRRK